MSEVVTHAHNEWWEKNLNSQADWHKFAGWLGQHNDPSRGVFVERVRLYDPESILELAPGMFRCYDNITKAGWQGRYEAIDITPQIVELGKEKGVNVSLANAEDLPFEDGSFDVVYCRHLMEHLDHYKATLSEMIRVAKKAVIVTFYKPPHYDEEDVIDLNEEMNVYHNHYSKSRLVEFLRTNPKFNLVSWADVTIPNVTYDMVMIVDLKEE